MTIGQSTDFQGAANLGRRNFLDTGSGSATCEIYGTVRPSDGDLAGGTPLVTVVLAKPCGEIVDGVLVLAADDPTGELILESGEAIWARFKNGDGAWAFDADVSADGGSGEVQFPNVNLLAGGRAPLSLSTIG